MSELMHYGTPRHSGRYPWGSGENPQRNKDFRAIVKDLKSKGMSEKEIAESMGLSTTQLRAKISISKDEERKANMARARELKDHGYSNVKIGEMMGLNESTVRSLLDPTIAERTTKTREVADILKDQIEKHGYLDVGPGTELYLDVTDTRLKNAIALLEEEGYKTSNIYVDQMGTNHKTDIKVLSKDDVPYSEIKNHQYDIAMLGSKQYDEDGALISVEPQFPPTAVDNKRIQICYNEEGGIEKDGVIELRRGVDDISLGAAQYAQVRIAVDLDGSGNGTHYLKGMAMYADDLPDGIDIRFNTNKHLGTPPEKVFKEMKDDPDNPFGASIKNADQLRMVQKYYIDADGNRKLSPINVVNEEGDWGEWSKTLSSQFLSKQRPELAKRQLDLAFQEKAAEFDEIVALTNPTVKRKLLESFADDCDASAVHLKAAALPHQGQHVILPIPTLKDDEIYAPNYEDGTQVVLIRHPHAGKFEIPTLTVRNKGSDAESVLHNAIDAVGINANVAERLSGADFDGDTVTVIPLSSKVRVSTMSPLRGLKDFDPKEAYPYHEGMTVMTPANKQKQMGVVSNLITDMTLKGATEEELARATRHSMVVIDSEKHKLDYKQSEIDNDIAGLKAKYQPDGGASTLISRAKSEQRVNTRKDNYKIDPDTGEKIWDYTNESYTKTTVNKRTGETKTEVVERKIKSTKMAEAEDAYTLTSGGSKENPGTQMEAIYADYANNMKDMANRARKEYINTPRLEYSPEAKKEYDAEVTSLNAKLNISLRNAPKERQAQLLANKIVETKVQSNPSIKDDKDKYRKVKGQALQTARQKTGAKKERIAITDKEWEAIQKGAISDSKLSQILNNADLDVIRKYATPRATTTLSPAKEAKARAMSKSGYTTKEIADAVGISTSSVSKLMAGLD